MLKDLAPLGIVTNVLCQWKISVWLKKQYTSLIAIFFWKNNISQHKKLELCKEKESTKIPIREY
jgi:hypothetical protein